MLFSRHINENDYIDCRKFGISVPIARSNFKGLTETVKWSRIVVVVRFLSPIYVNFGGNLRIAHTTWLIKKLVVFLFVISDFQNSNFQILCYRYFNNKKIWNCRDFHNQIWIEYRPFWQWKFCNFWDGHGQNWLDHFDHRTSILAKWPKKIVVIGPPNLIKSIAGL
jgi:hypothetical protein